MEDGILSVENALGGFFLTGVFDGHGGTTAVNWLENEFYRILDSSLSSEAGKAQDLQLTPKHLHRVFANVDKQLLAHLKVAEGETRMSGATATVALLRDDQLIVANIGDCKAMLCRKAQPVMLTEDHRVYGFGPSVDAEIERVTSAGGWIVDGRVCNTLAVSRAFGDWEFKGEGLKHLLKQGAADGLWTPDFAADVKFSADPVVATPQVTEVELVPEDEFLVIATDGLWDFMPPLDVLRWTRRELKAGKSAEDVADSLCGLALKRYTADNVAVVVVDLKGRDYWTAKPPKPKRSSMFGFLNKKKAA